MLTINLQVGSRYQLNRQFLREALKQILIKQHIGHACLDVSIVGERKMKAVNQLRTGQATVTDVLSFPLHEKNQLHDFPLPSGIPPHLGDIVICYPVAQEQAKRFGKLVDVQLLYLAEHGLLHLLGYHHE